MIKRKIKTTLLTYFLAILTVGLGMSAAKAQTKDEVVNTEEEVSTLMLIRTYAGVEYIGEVLSLDPREVLIQTKSGEQIIIPRHEVALMESLGTDALNNGIYLGEDRFATRYFYSTNGLSIKKGEHYASLNYYGPEVHFALTDNLSVGLMTTWIAAPVVVSAKLSIPISDKFHLGVGGLAGSLSWIETEAVGALGYGTATFGDRKRNLSISGGFAAIRDPWNDGDNNAGLLSIAGMNKLGRHSSLVFDSFFLFNQNGPVAILIPGLRVSTRNQRGAFQFGVGVAKRNDRDNVTPFPMASYFISLR